jgi:hypothetical protein
MILYLLIGILFQWLMYYGTIKISPQSTFTHWERILLVVFWPLGVLMFVYSFIKSFISK